MNNKRIDSIDGIRGIACLLIMMFHFSGTNVHIPLVSRWGGGLGVEIFYCLSGFCISRSLYVEKIVNREQKYSCLDFIIDRIKKIYPTYILSLVFIIFTQGPRNLSEILINVFLIQSGWLGKDFAMNGPTWFLSTLLLCYIVFYVFNRYFGKSENRLFLYICIMIYSKIIVDAQSTLPVIGESFGYAMLPFFAGCILSYVQDYIENDHKKLVTVVFIADIVLIAASVAGNMIFGTEKALGDYWMIFSLLLVPMSVFSIINIKWLDVIFANKLFVMLGAISMYAYIWHVPLGSFLRRIFTNTGFDIEGYAFLGIAVVVTLVVAALNRLIETKAKGLLIKH